MSPLKYIIQSFTYFRKQNLAVFLATLLSTAILTGAMVIGDSVRHSLNSLVDKRLGSIGFAMQTGERFVSENLSANLEAQLGETVAGLLTLNGLVINPDEDMRINSVEILGVDSTFWSLSNQQQKDLQDDQVFISENIAQRLKLQVGDELLLRVQNVDAIPINAPFAQDKMATLSFRLEVMQIVDDESLGRYSLKSDQKAPYNIWVSKAMLGRKMNLAHKVNTLLVADSKKTLEEEALQAALKKTWSMADVGLQLKTLPEKGVMELTTDRIFIDHTVSDKLIQVFHAQPVLTYLVNALSFEGNETPYSFVSGLAWPVSDQAPADDQIIVNDWCARDLGLQTGDSLSLEYYVIGPYRKLITASKKFEVLGIEPNQGVLFQADLMPDFPGLSDAESCSDWDTGVPIDLKKIRDKDEDYWNKFRGTPKAIVNIDVARKLWGNPFGDYTAFRFENKETASLALAASVMAELDPMDIGLQFRNVKSAGKRAATNSVDFGELFLSLSFFVIVASLILLVLAYSLHLLSRKQEIKVLSALGVKGKNILRLFFGESLLSLVFGGVIGTGVGILYNQLLMAGLNTLWQDAVRTHALALKIIPQTLVIAFFSGLIIAALSMFIVIRKQIRKTLLPSRQPQIAKSLHLKRNGVLALLGYMLGAGLVLFSIISGQVENASLFLSAGGLILIALIAHVNLILKRQLSISENQSFGVFRLCMKNISRQRSRSLTVILLLALGTFSVIITGANRKTFYGSEEQRKSGTGGFLYWVENSIPIKQNLNSAQGKAALNIADEAIADSMQFYQMYQLDGDDASCLNLNQVQAPGILGVDATGFDALKAFSFAALLPRVNPDAPWLELQKTYGKQLIPAYVDQTVITWGLMKKVGDTLLYKDEQGNDLGLIIAGGLNSSVFQGHILIADAQFQKYFPSSAQSKSMLIDADKRHATEIARLLDFYFQDYGVDYELTLTRLAEFNSVTNTYLDVFMVLGALGMLIGTIGFAIILLRNRLERRPEFALLTALGFTTRQRRQLIFTEHVILLISGLVIGIIAAGIAILPSLILPVFSIPLVFLLVLISIIFLNGLFWIWLSTQIKGDANLIQALRSE